MDARRCAIIRTKSSYWYITKSLLQVAAVTVVYHISMTTLKKLQQVDLQPLKSVIDQVELSSSDRMKIDEEMNRASSRLESSVDDRSNWHTRMKEILLVLAAIKLVSVTRYIFKKMSLYRQCIRTYRPGVTPGMRV